MFQRRQTSPRLTSQLSNSHQINLDGWTALHVSGKTCFWILGWTVPLRMEWKCTIVSCWKTWKSSLRKAQLFLPPECTPGAACVLKFNWTPRGRLRDESSLNLATHPTNRARNIQTIHGVKLNSWLRTRRKLQVTFSINRTQKKNNRIKKIHVQYFPRSRLCGREKHADTSA